MRGGPEARVVVLLQPRSILTGLGILLGVAAAVKFTMLAQAGLTLVATALILAVALTLPFEFFQRCGLGRGWAVAAVYAVALAGVACLGLVLLPPLVEQIGKFVDALPGLVADLTKGHGPLGWLACEYDVVGRVHSATTGQSAGSLLGEATSAFSAVRGSPPPSSA